jgi:hypothetical protein
MAKKRVSKKPIKFTNPFDAEGRRLRDIVDELADESGDEGMLVADGFDAAIIGITEDGEPVVVYDWDKCVKILEVRDGMSNDDAVEYMSFNVTGANVGPRTPIFIRFV